jgi:hypothetical protein
MPQPPITADVLEPRNVRRHLAAQLPLDGVVLVEQGREPSEFVLVEIAGIGKRIDSGLVAEFACDPRPHAVQVLQGVDRLLFGRDVDAHQTRHDLLPAFL